MTSFKLHKVDLKAGRVNFELHLEVRNVFELLIVYFIFSFLTAEYKLFNYDFEFHIKQ